MKRPKGFRYAPPEAVPPARDFGAPEEIIADPQPESSAQATDAIVLDLSDRMPIAEVEERAREEHDEGGLQPEVLDLDQTQEIAEARGPKTRFLRRSEARAAENAEYREAKRALKTAERARKRRERSERHRFTQQQRVARRRMLIVLGAVSVLALSVAVGVFTPLMSVQHVDVRGTERVPVATITDALSGLQGTPLALVTDEDVHDQLQGLTLLESFAVEKVPPSTLRIVVAERQPVVAVAHGDVVLLIDPAGVRIDEVAREERPAGIPLAPSLDGTYDSDEFLAIAQSLRSMPEGLRQRVIEVEADTPQQISFVLDDGLPVMWGDASQNSRKAVVLDAMLAALSGTALQSVDVSSPEAPVYVPAG